MEIQPRKPSAKAPAELFTGDVWVDILTQGQGAMTIGFVHFTPGARTAWHSHAISQTLFVTEGEGRVQSRGEPVTTIRPGEVVYTPGEEWHWHGAAPEHFMTHLAMTEGAAEWGEHVTDAEYRGDPA
jgi:quercetin dioxygenase-like cupin family protein